MDFSENDKVIFLRNNSKFTDQIFVVECMIDSYVVKCKPNYHFPKKYLKLLDEIRLEKLNNIFNI